jgi:hypothetical protein
MDDPAEATFARAAVTKRWSLFAPWGMRHESKELTGAGANLEFS